MCVWVCAILAHRVSGAKLLQGRPCAVKQVGVHVRYLSGGSAEVPTKPYVPFVWRLLIGGALLDTGGPCVHVHQSRSWHSLMILSLVAFAVSESGTML